MRGRRLLPPDPWGITPRAQRVMDGASGKSFYAPSSSGAGNGMYEMQGQPMPRKPKTTAAKANAALGSIFKSAPQHRTPAKALEELGGSRAKVNAKEPPAPRSRRRTPPKSRVPNDVEERAALAFGKKPDPRKDVSMDDLPVLGAPWMKIQERIFDLPDPEAEYTELTDALALTDALTPGNLEQALNTAENNARRCHRMYIVARADFERFELEMTPVTEAMREAANRDLQGEKDKKQRSKAITDADIRGRASVLYPDEWARVMTRRSKAEAMQDDLKHFAEMWKQRCYSLSALVNAGKRS